MTTKSQNPQNSEPQGGIQTPSGGDKPTTTNEVTPKKTDSTMDLVAKLLESETSPETQELKRLILKRIATETDIRPARVPAPLNITEIGGYYNLLRKNEKLQMQLLASVLGLPYSS